MKRRMSVSFDEGAEQSIEYSIEVDGLFMYKDNMSASDSIKAFLSDFHYSIHDFNECYGVYRIKVSSDNKTIYFADNSGMMRYYINRNNHTCHCSLEEAEKEKNNRIPNYSAIAQFLSYGCTYNNETAVESVVLSDPNLYYVFKDKQMTQLPKNLKKFSDYKDDRVPLDRFISQAVAHCEGKIGCTITGGMDSRSVLANLIDLGIEPHLYITGHESQTDVKIAKEIADTTNLPLTVVSDEIEEESWLNHSAEAADGQEGICGIYRLDKLARKLHTDGIELQFGGVNGEMYKNSFINQDFPFYFGKPKWDRFYQYKVGTFDYDQTIFAEKIWNEMEKLPSVITGWLKTHEEENKANAYLNVGYEIMQARCNLVINMFERHTTIYNPLMERRLAVFAYGKNPYTFEMQAFQRQEVTQHCKEIRKIKTDRGLTCDYSSRASEFLKSYLFLIRVAIQRVFLRKQVDIRVESSIDEAQKSEYFRSAFSKVKALNIINSNLEVEKIPVGLADRLFTIGLLFD